MNENNKAVTNQTTQKCKLKIKHDLCGQESFIVK